MTDSSATAQDAAPWKFADFVRTAPQRIALWTDQYLTRIPADRVLREVT